MNKQRWSVTMKVSAVVALALAVGAGWAIEKARAEMTADMAATQSDIAQFQAVVPDVQDLDAWPSCSQLESQYETLLSQTKTSAGVVLARSIREHGIALGCGAPQHDPQEVAVWTSEYDKRSRFSWPTRVALRFSRAASAMDGVRAALTRPLDASIACEHEKAKAARAQGELSPAEALGEVADGTCSAG